MKFKTEFLSLSLGSFPVSCAKLMSKYRSYFSDSVISNKKKNANIQGKNDKLTIS